MNGMGAGLGGATFSGNIQPQQGGPWWTAFGTGGFEGEPPLLEGTSLHALTVINRFNRIRLYRTRDQLFPYPSEVNDSSQPSKSR